MSIGSKIFELRKRDNLTQAQLAAKLECAGTLVSSWERDIGVPSDDYREKLAFIFNESADYFIENTKERLERKESLRTKETTKESVGPVLLRYKTRNGDVLELPDTPESQELFRELALKMMTELSVGK